MLQADIISREPGSFGFVLGAQGHLDCLDVLAELGADLSGLNADGWAPAHAAAAAGQAASLVKLRDLGALEVLNEERAQPLAAMFQGSVQKPFGILGKKANPTKQPTLIAFFAQITALHCLGLFDLGILTLFSLNPRFFSSA